MKTAYKKEPNITLQNTCPHLGLSDDPKTLSDYPSEWNVCHCAKPPAMPNFHHQEKHCLT